MIDSGTGCGARAKGGDGELQHVVARAVADAVAVRRDWPEACIASDVREALLRAGIITSKAYR